MVAYAYNPHIIPCRGNRKIMGSRPTITTQGDHASKTKCDITEQTKTGLMASLWATCHHRSQETEHWNKAVCQCSAEKSSPRTARVRGNWECEERESKHQVGTGELAQHLGKAPLLLSLIRTSGQATSLSMSLGITHWGERGMDFTCWVFPIPCSPLAKRCPLPLDSWFHWCVSVATTLSSQLLARQTLCYFPHIWAWTCQRNQRIGLL